MTVLLAVMRDLSRLDGVIDVEVFSGPSESQIASRGRLALPAEDAACLVTMVNRAHARTLALA